MDKVKLEILGLSHNQGVYGSYVVILSSVDSDIKIPVVLNTKDSTELLQELTNKNSSQDSMTAVYKQTLNEFGLSISEVYIDKLTEGKFSVKLSIEGQLGKKTIDCSIVNAIIISNHFNLPIYTNDSVTRLSGFKIDNDGNPVGETHSEKPRPSVESSKVTNLESLKESLRVAIEEEDYEEAANIRDRIREIEE